MSERKIFTVDCRESRPDVCFDIRPDEWLKDGDQIRLSHREFKRIANMTAWALYGIDFDEFLKEAEAQRQRRMGQWKLKKHERHVYKPNIKAMVRRQFSGAE